MATLQPVRRPKSLAPLRRHDRPLAPSGLDDRLPLWAHLVHAGLVVLLITTWAIFYR